MTEPFSVKKALDFSPVAMGKVSSIGIKLFFILVILFCIGYTIYTLFFPKPTQTQIIKAEKGAVLNIQQKQTTRRFFIPFIEGGVEQRSDRNMSTYLRAGLRIEF